MGAEISSKQEPKPNLGFPLTHLVGFAFAKPELAALGHVLLPV